MIQRRKILLLFFLLILPFSSLAQVAVACPPTEEEFDAAEAAFKAKDFDRSAAYEGEFLNCQLRATASTANMLGLIEMIRGRYVAAEMAFKQAVTLDPANPRYRNNLANAKEAIQSTRREPK